MRKYPWCGHDSVFSAPSPTLTVALPRVAPPMRMTTSWISAAQDCERRQQADLEKDRRPASYLSPRRREGPRASRPARWRLPLSRHRGRDQRRVAETEHPRFRPKNVKGLDELVNTGQA
jgi:hypothetical protein